MAGMLGTDNVRQVLPVHVAARFRDAEAEAVRLYSRIDKLLFASFVELRPETFFQQYWHERDAHHQGIGNITTLLLVPPSASVARSCQKK